MNPLIIFGLRPSHNTAINLLWKGDGLMRRYRLPACAVLALTLSLLAACGQQQTDGNQMSYKEMKSMVIDILGSEEGKQAIEKASAGKGTGLQALGLQDRELLRVTVKNVLTSPEYSKELEKIMTDPQFAGEFAKAVNKENKEIHKALMKDPTYRKDLVSVMKEPDMQSVLVEATKTSEYRSQMMNAVQEAIQSPLFKLEIIKMLQSVVKQELNPEQKKDGQQQQQGGEGSKGGGGGGDGGSTGSHL